MTRVQLVGIWCRSHGADARALLLMGLGWCLIALTSWIGVPGRDLRLSDDEARLVVVGVIGLAVLGALAGRGLHDRLAWQTRLSVRRMRTWRALWFLGLLAANGVAAIAVGPLLPPGLLGSPGYLSSVAMWFGIALLSAVVLPVLSALIVPFALVAALAATGIVPRAVNPVGNPDLELARWSVGLVTLAIAGVLYAVRGVPADRE